MNEVIQKYISLMRKENYEDKEKPYFVCLFDFMNSKGAIGREIKLSDPSELREILDKI